jgi:hypothetical protein
MWTRWSKKGRGEGEKPEASSGGKHLKGEGRRAEFHRKDEKDGKGMGEERVSVCR